MSDGVVNIGTNIDDAQLKQQLSNLSGKMNKMLNGISFAAIGKGAIEAGKAVAGLVSDVMTTTDNVDKMSQKLGLSRKTFQEWDYVMGQSGMSIDTLKTGMTKFNKNILENKDAFKALGIEVNSSMSKDQLFEMTINKLRGMGDTMERARLATELFGKAGADMAPILNTSAAGIEALKKEAHDMGIIMSDETIDSGVKLGDAIDKLKQTFSGLMAEALTPLMPIITDLATQFSEILPPLLEFIAPLLSMLIPALGEIVQALLPQLLVLFEALLPILQPLIDILLLLCETVLVPFITLFSEIIVAIMPGFIEILMLVIEALGPFLLTLSELVYTLMPVLIQVFTYIIDNVLEGFGAAFKAIMPIVQAVLDALGNLIDFIVNVFQGDWKGAWESIGKFFTNIWDGIKMVFAGVVNSIIRGINKLIQGLNKLHFKMPDWLGGGEFGFNIKEIQEIKIETSGNYQEKTDEMFEGSKDKIPQVGIPADADKDAKTNMALGSGVDIESLLQSDGYAGSGVSGGYAGSTVGNITGDITKDKSLGGSDGARKMVTMRNIYIDVTGNTFRDEADINKTGDMLVQRLKLAGVL